MILFNNRNIETDIDYEDVVQKLRVDLKRGLAEIDNLSNILIKERLILEGHKDLDKSTYQQVKQVLINNQFLQQVLQEGIIATKEDKERAVLTLFEIGTPQAVDYVIPFLYVDDKEVKKLVIKNLAQINNSKAAITLVDYLDYCNEVSVQQTLKKSFCNLGEECVPKLLELLNSDNQHLSWIIKLLGEIGAEEAINPLLEILADSSQSEIRVSAAKSLAQFIDQPEVFNELLQALNDDDCHVRAQIVKLLGQVEKPQVLTYLYHMLRDSSGIVRNNAARALLQSGEPGIKYLILAAEEEEIPEIISCLEQVDTLELIKFVKEAYQAGKLDEDSNLLRVVEESDQEELIG
ncbi:HEAT repeat domain-containing protein [Halanaerocella petrolearia]